MPCSNSVVEVATVMDVDTNKRSAEGAAEAPAPKRSREDDDNADVAMAVSFPPPANVTDAAYVKTMDQYKEMHNQSLQSPVRTRSFDLS